MVGLSVASLAINANCIMKKTWNISVYNNNNKISHTCCIPESSTGLLLLPFPGDFLLVLGFGSEVLWFIMVPEDDVI